MSRQQHNDQGAERQEQPNLEALRVGQFARAFNATEDTLTTPEELQAEAVSLAEETTV